MASHNLNTNHIGIAVDDHDKALDWYSRHLGFRRIRSNKTVDQTKDGQDVPAFRIFGDELKKVKVAFLTTGDGVGFELFQFIDPPTKSAEVLRREFSIMEHRQQGGVFYIGFTAPDPEAVAKAACADGAVRIGETIEVGEGLKARYLRDPWGMAVEVLPCGFETLLANQG